MDMDNEGRHGQVYERLKRLEGDIESLTSTVGQIESRLLPILRAADEDNNKPGVVEEGLVPLAASVDTLSMRVGKQLRRLDAILARLEL